jgi:dTDP-4-dehydrorhamnose 3,5-epimerase
MKRVETDIEGVYLIEPDVYGDTRGYFMETWNARRYQDLGISEHFVQDNISRSQQGILRGLHYQHPYAQGKLVSVLEGEVFDVAVDLRRGSPTFKQWTGHMLSSGNKRQLYIPPGCAHGFLVTSETALFHYKCTEFYHPETEVSIRWNDPELAISWPDMQPQLSAKDAAARLLADLEPERLPAYEPVAA